MVAVEFVVSFAKPAVVRAAVTAEIAKVALLMLSELPPELCRYL